MQIIRLDYKWNYLNIHFTGSNLEVSSDEEIENCNILPRNLISLAVIVPDSELDDFDIECNGFLYSDSTFIATTICMSQFDIKDLYIRSSPNKKLSRHKYITAQNYKNIQKVYVSSYTLVYYAPRRIMRVITRRATMLAGNRSQCVVEA